MKTQSFSISEAVRYGWGTTKQNLIFLAGLVLLMFILTFVPSALAGYLEEGGNVIVFSLINTAVWVLQMIVSIGMLRISLDLHDGRPVSYATLFQPKGTFLKYLITAIIAGIIAGIPVILGALIVFAFPVADEFFMSARDFMVLLIAIVVSMLLGLRLQFAAYDVVDKQADPIKAISHSWHMTDGQTMKLFLLTIVYALIMVLGLIALGVGILAALPTVMMANVFVYRRLTS